MGAPRRIGLILLGSFVIAVTTFPLAVWLANREAQGVLRTAESIVADAVPAIRHIGKMRTTLAELRSALRECVEGSCDEARIADLSREVRTEWDRYVMLPPYSRERDRWPSIVSNLTRLDEALDALLRQFHAGDVVRVQVTVRAAGLVLDDLNEQLGSLVDFNAQSAIDLGKQVVSLRRTSRAWELALDAISAFFAIVAAIAALYLVRDYARLTGGRIHELERFAGRVAHDLRSPLASVSIALGLVEKQTDDPRLRGLVVRGGRTLERVGQLVDGLLVFAHAGAPPAQGARAKTADTIRGVIEDLQLAAQEKEVELCIEESEDVDVACSSGVLVSMLSNLVGNAIKYMGDAPVRRVTVRTRGAHRRVRVEVQDTGPGISKEMQQRIFDPHVRGVQATAPGFGLGLATVRRLAEAHHGAVGVESVRGGSLFWFELPEA
jgi:signal transduction histidine kinase